MKSTQVFCLFIKAGCYWSDAGHCHVTMHSMNSPMCAAVGDGGGAVVYDVVNGVECSLVAITVYATTKVHYDKHYQL